MREKTLFILAAGMGSRYGGNKQVACVGQHGETLMDYSIFDALSAGFERFVFLIRGDFFVPFREAMDHRWGHKAELVYAFQELDMLPKPFRAPEQRQKPWGTAHALLCAKDALTQPFATINADDFYGKDAFVCAAKKIDEGAISERQYAAVLYPISKTLSDFGQVNRGVCELGADDEVKNITEVFAIDQCPDGRLRSRKTQEWLAKDTLVSMNFWVLHPYLLDLFARDFPRFLRENLHHPQEEFLLPTLLGDYTQKGEIRIQAECTDCLWFGLTYQQDLAAVQHHIRSLVRQGNYPEKL